MLYYTIAFGIGIGVGVFVGKLFYARKTQQLEEQLINCQKMIYDLTIKNCSKDSMPDFDKIDEAVCPSANMTPLEVDEELLRDMKEQAVSDSQFVDQLKTIIQKHIDDERFGVEDLSREIGISRVHLNRKLKQVLNVSPNQLILDIRMKYAASLLVDSMLNVGEVAFRLGFRSYSYFSSKFKEYFGLTPSEYVDTKK